MHSRYCVQCVQSLDCRATWIGRCPFISFIRSIPFPSMTDQDFRPHLNSTSSSSSSSSSSVSLLPPLPIPYSLLHTPYSPYSSYASPRTGDPQVLHVPALHPGLTRTHPHLLRASAHAACLLPVHGSRGSGRMTPTPCYTAADDLGQLPRVHHAVLPLAHQNPHQPMCGPNQSISASRGLGVVKEGDHPGGRRAI